MAGWWRQGVAVKDGKEQVVLVGAWNLAPMLDNVPFWD
jgi:hypothetical protein